jgi:hypothetical protein
MLGRLFFRRPRRCDAGPIPCLVRTTFIPWRVPASLAAASAAGCDLRMSDRVEPGDRVLLETDRFRPLPARVTHVHEHPDDFEAKVEFSRPLSGRELRELLGDAR